MIPGFSGYRALTVASVRAPAVIFEEELTAWCNEVDSAISEQEKISRRLACEKIKDYYNLQERGQSPGQLYLERLNLTSLPNLEPLYTLKSLHLSTNKFTSFNAPKLPLLTHLFLDNNHLASLNVSNFPALTHLSLNDNSFTSFDASNLPKLMYLNLNHNTLSSFNASNLPALTDLHLNHNTLTSLTITNLPRITDVDLGCNHFSLLNVSNLPLLRSLFLDHNHLLTSFEASNLPGLTCLNLQENPLLISFTAVNLLALTCLELTRCPLTSFTAKNLPALTTLRLIHTSLASLTTENLPRLTEVDLSYNRFSSFNIASFPELKQLRLVANQLTSFTASDLPALEYLDLQSNKFCSLTIANLPALKRLYLDNNPFTSFTAVNLAVLEALDLSQHKLISFTASNLPMLERLILSDNKLSSFDASRFPNLTSLWLDTNQFASLGDIILPPVPHNLYLLFLLNNPLVRSSIVTMRVPLGVIQGIPTEQFLSFGIEIISRQARITTGHLQQSLTKLCPGLEVSSSFQNLLTHPQAPTLAIFVERMMLSWPKYDSFLCSFAILAKDNENFRADLFENVFSASSNCHDRPLYLFSKLSALVKVYQAQDQKNHKELAQYLIALHHLDYIDQVANEVSVNEALEIALYLQLQLKYRLSLPIAIDGMAYGQYAEKLISPYLAKPSVQPGQSQMTIPETIPEWIDRVGKRCQSLSADRQQQLAILENSSFLQKASKQYEEFKNLKTDYETAMALLSPVKEEIDESSNIAVGLSLAQQAFSPDGILLPSVEAFRRSYEQAPETHKLLAIGKLNDLRSAAEKDLLARLTRTRAKELLELGIDR